MRPLEDTLGIFVITYNRASRLDRTLASLLKTSFARCAITVLDNNSTDETPSVCAAYAARFPNMTVVRRRVNVGLSANYLRAVELADKPYTWVLGDDDDLDGSQVDDILDQLDSDRPDLLIVGAVNQPNWALGEALSARELFARGFPYFYVTGWITGVIFRTSLFGDDSFHLGYKNSDNVFPHYPFFAKCLAQNASVYVAKRWVAGSREGGEYGRLGSEMIAGWMNSAKYIADPETRRLALWQGPIGQGHHATLAQAASLFFRVFGVHSVARRSSLAETWFKCWVVATPDIRLAMVPSFVHVISPSWLAQITWKLQQRLAGRGRRRIEEYTAALDEART
jgi:hypothetical protein